MAVKELALQPILWTLLGGVALTALRMPLPEAVSVRQYPVCMACCTLAAWADNARLIECLNGH